MNLIWRTGIRRISSSGDGERKHILAKAHLCLCSGRMGNNAPCCIAQEKAGSPTKMDVGQQISILVVRGAPSHGQEISCNFYSISDATRATSLTHLPFEHAVGFQTVCCLFRSILVDKLEKSRNTRKQMKKRYPNMLTVGF